MDAIEGEAIREGRLLGARTLESQAQSLLDQAVQNLNDDQDDPLKEYARIARDMLDQIEPNEARVLADAADEALDNGRDSLSVRGPQGPIRLPAIFLEALLDEIVKRYPDVRDTILSPREPGRSSRIPPSLVQGLSHRIEIAYEDATGARSDRIVTVRRVLGEARNGPEYIAGVCHNRVAVRHFRLDRILQLTDLTTGEIIVGRRGIHAWAVELMRTGGQHEPC